MGSGVLRTFIVLAIAVLAVTGCGGGPDTAAQGTPAPTEAPPTSSATESAATEAPTEPPLEEPTESGLENAGLPAEQVGDIAFSSPCGAIDRSGVRALLGGKPAFTFALAPGDSYPPEFGAGDDFTASVHVCGYWADDGGAEALTVSAGHPEEDASRWQEIADSDDCELADTSAGNVYVMRCSDAAIGSTVIVIAESSTLSCGVTGEALVNKESEFFALCAEIIGEVES